MSEQNSTIEVIEDRDEFIARRNELQSQGKEILWVRFREVFFVFEWRDKV